MLIPDHYIIFFTAIRMFMPEIMRPSNTFIRKGALMLRIWQSPEAHPTIDIDMPGMTSTQYSEMGDSDAPGGRCEPPEFFE